MGGAEGRLGFLGNGRVPLSKIGSDFHERETWWREEQDDAWLLLAPGMFSLHKKEGGTRYEGGCRRESCPTASAFLKT